MDKNVKICAECPLCKFTRNSKKPTILYNIARLIQKICPNCTMANKALNKNFQDSNFL